MPFEKIIEEKIREAIEAGQFNNLAGRGQPLDLTAYFATPPDVRLGYSVLKSAGCVPEEVALRQEIALLQTKLVECVEPSRKEQIKKELDGKMLKLNLLTDSQRHTRRNAGFF
jgi:hypothetical protein